MEETPNSKKFWYCECVVVSCNKHNTMIQPNELRIGNWVNLIALDQKIRINSISELEDGGLFTWIHENEEFEDSLTAISPIHITPEVLEKCGAKNPANNDPYGGVLITINELVSIRLIPLPDGTGYYWDNFNCSYKVILKYLHQLQNLYFALTGEELNYTP